MKEHQIRNYENYENLKVGKHYIGHLNFNQIWIDNENSNNTIFLKSRYMFMVLNWIELKWVNCFHYYANKYIVKIKSWNDQR